MFLANLTNIAPAQGAGNRVILRVVPKCTWAFHILYIRLIFVCTVLANPSDTACVEHATQVWVFCVRCEWCSVSDVNGVLCQM